MSQLQSPVYTLPKKRGKVFIRLYNSRPSLATVKMVPQEVIPESLRWRYEQYIASTNRRVECIPGTSTRTLSLKVDITIDIDTLQAQLQDPLISYIVSLYKDDIKAYLTLQDHGQADPNTVKDINSRVNGLVEQADEYINNTSLV